MSEVSKRELINFDWESIIKEGKGVYDNVRNNIISDIQNEEADNEIKFQINDINMYIPPLHIGINKENLEYSWKTLRSKVSTKVFSNSGIYNIQMTLLFPRETLLELHRLIIQIRNNPFICIKNRYLSSSLSTTDYFQVFKFNNTAMSGSMMKSTHFVVTNMQCVNYQASPGSFLVELDLRIFNTSPYSADLKYRHDLFYLLGGDKLSTIDAFFSGVTSDMKNPLVYSDRILENITRTATASIRNPSIDGNEFQNKKYYSYEINEKIPSFGVEYPFESCIFVRYYNYLQAKHLYLNFNINIQEELISYFIKNNLPVKELGEKFNFQGYHDFFNIGLINLQTNTSYRVLSLASKYMPLSIRNFVSDKMLEEDDTFTLLYETYITLNLDEKLLNKIRKIICNSVRFDITEDTELKVQQEKQLQKNIADFKNSVNTTVDGATWKYSVIDYRSPIESNTETITLDSNEIKKIKGYLAATSSLDFVPDFSAFIERRLNVFSTVEVVNLAASPTEDRGELLKLLLLKPLVVTSCSAMLTNSVATIPIIGHTYPTYQYLGSHEPIYQLTFAANSFGNDPEVLDDLPNGIKTIETFRYEMEHNIQNFKQIPNSHAFSLKCFMTKLFDSYRISDVNIVNRESKQELNNNVDVNNDTPESSRLIKKRLSINAINTQTLEGSPGTTVGSLRFSETNNFDIETLQLVYNEGYGNLDGYAQKIYALAKDYCDNQITMFEVPKDIPKDLQVERMGRIKDAIKQKFGKQAEVRRVLDNQGVGHYMASFDIDNPSEANKYKLDDLEFLELEVEYLEPYSDIPAELQYIEIDFKDEAKAQQANMQLMHQIRNKDVLTEDERKIDNILKAICNFKYLASSLLIEPEYYLIGNGKFDTELRKQEKTKLNQLFYKIFTFDDADKSNKDVIYPMYMRYLRSFLISSESIDNALQSNEKIKQIISNKENNTSKNDLKGYLDVNVGWGVVSSIGPTFYTKSVLIGLITTVAGSAINGALQDVRLENLIINGGLDTNKQRVNQTITKQFKNSSATLTQKEEGYINDIFNLDRYLKPTDIGFYLSKMIRDSLPYELFVRTQVKDSLPDVGASITTKILNTNPIFQLYSNDILDQNLVNAIILPDETTSKANRLLFNGFEQRIFSYLFWFPKQTDKTFGINVLAEDWKYYHDIFKHVSTEAAFNVKLKREERNLYQDINDNLRNLMINSEWSLLYQNLPDDQIDKIIQMNNSENDSIVLNKTVIDEFKEERQNNDQDYLLLLCKKDIQLQKAIKSAQDNRVAYLENLFNELILMALNQQEITSYMNAIINANKFEKSNNEEIKFFNSITNEVNGLDVSNSNCYPDIDLPMRPLAFDNERLNPGFFYFDNNKELFLPQEVAIRKKQDRDIAKSLLKKSYTFMQELRKGNVYSGNSSWNFIEDEAKKQNSERSFFVQTNTSNKKDQSGDQTTDQIKRSIVTFQDSTMTDYQEGGMLLEKINLDLSTDKDNYIYTAPKVTFMLADEDDGTVIYDSSDKLDEELVKKSRGEAIKNDDKNKIKVYRIKEDAYNLNQEVEFELNVFYNENVGGAESAVKSVSGDKLLPIIDDVNGKDLLLDSSKAGLFYQSNFNLLEDNETNEIDNTKLEQYGRFLKNSLYGDGEQSIEGILNNLENSMSFLNRRTISQMYPTFKFYIVEEDAFESDNPLVFDDFYSFNAIKDITIYKNRKLPADTAVVRLQNVSGSIDGSKPTGLRDIDYDMAGVDEQNANQIGLQNNGMNLNSVLLRPGVTTQIRLGYESNPNKLEVMLSGKITDINWSSNGDMCEVVIQSFGTELLAKKIGTKEDGVSSNFSFNNTDTILKFMIHQSDLKHFGKFKKGYKSKVFEDNSTRKLEINISRPRSAEVSWMDTVRNLYSSYGFYTTIGIGLTASILTLVSLKFPKVGATIARVINKSGTFLYSSRFVTAITLFSNKLFFRGFGLGDDVIGAAATSIVAKSGGTVTKIDRLKALFTPTWAEYFFKGTRFRDLSAKIGYNNAVYRLINLSNSTSPLAATAGSAVTIISAKGGVNIFMSSFLGTAFKTYLGINILNFGLGLSATAVSGMLDAFSNTFSFLMNEQSAYSETKAKLKLAFSKDEIIYSPMDDCIYPPYPSTYIMSNRAFKTEGDEGEKKVFIFDDGDDRGLYYKYSHSIRSIIAEAFNTIGDIMLRSWVFFQIVDMPIGLLNYRFSSTPHYLDASTKLVEDANSSLFFPSLVETSHFAELTKNPYAVADKRLYEVVGENKYQIYNKTIWEIFEEMTLRHPGWVTTTRPYGLGTEYRIFFGLPSDKLYKRELSFGTKTRLSKIIDKYFDFSNDKITKKNPKLNLEEIVPLLSLKYQRYIKELSKKVITDDDATIEKLRDAAESLMIKDCLETTNSRYTMLRNYHYLNSEMNIVSCNISLNDKAPNTVNVNYLHTFDENQRELEATEYKRIYTRKMQAHPYIPDEAINEIAWNESNPDTIQCKGYGAALRYGMSLLINGAKEMYDGEIITIGNPNINPFDIVLIEDKVNGISGPVEVEAVTHMFSFDTGYLTEIKPNALVTGNEAMTYSITSTAPVFLATEQVVKKLSRRSYLLKKNQDGTRVIDDVTKNEIKGILDSYFKKPDLKASDLIFDRNQPNFWYDFVNKNSISRIFNNRINDTQLEQVVNQINNAVLENILKALSENKIDVLVNMKQGLFQVPDGITETINRISGDITNAGSIAAVFAAATDFLTRKATIDKLSRGWVVNILGAIKNSGKLGAMIAIGTALFGDKIESTIEEFISNESTLNNILNLTQETRFSKINDGTLLHVFPLYKNEKALLGASFQYIRQNEIWHNRVGQIYNDVSDAALGYLQMRKQLQTTQDFSGQIKEIIDNQSAFKKVGIYFYNRYMKIDQKTDSENGIQPEIQKEVILSNSSPSSLISTE